MTLSDWFNVSIICVILLAGALVGFQTYEFANEDPALSYCTVIDNVILCIFIIECVLKMLAEVSFLTASINTWGVYLLFLLDKPAALVVLYFEIEVACTR